ncbi:MAG: aldo/keto reductase [Chloroflexota bacterium]
MQQRSALSRWSRRPLGGTGLVVDPVCIGCAPLGNQPRTYGYGVDEEQGLATARAIFAAPVNYIDTAVLYGSGESERRLGVVLREMGGLPEGFVLQTKTGRDHLTPTYFSGAQVRESIGQSRRRLGLERLQMVYLHDPDQSTWEWVNAPGGPLEALEQLKEEGVIEHLGVAAWDVSLLMRYVDTGKFEAVITHNRYNLLVHDAEPLIEFASARGLAVLNGAPYGSGILAKGPAAYPRYRYAEASPELLEKATRIEAACQRYDVPLAAASLQFSLRDPRVTSTIVGVSRPERVRQTIEMADYPIPESLWTDLAALI